MNEIPYLMHLRREVVGAARRRTAVARRRRLIVVPVTALLMLLLVGGVAVSDLRWPLPDDVPPGTEPVQKGPTASVATGTVNGEGWVLTARHVDDGDMCVGIQYGPGWGEGCGFSPIKKRPVGYQLDNSFSPTPATFVYGHVAREVDRVVIHLTRGGRHTVRTVEAQGFGVKFYVGAFEGMVDVRGVTGLDANGKVVGRAR